METLKLQKRVTEKLHAALENDIKHMIKHLLQTCDIHCRKTKKQMEESEIYETISSQFMHVKYCSAVLKNNKRCSKKIMDNNLYCNLHKDKSNETWAQTYRNFLDDAPSVLAPTELNVVTPSELNAKGLIMKFIDDQFFYVDDTYIYDKETLERCGYVNKSDCNEKYILCNDPFVLGKF
uniref:Uncharacterized protein n=1 Tax=viral metagenome TaxID=1070528 RepID=A0A6C0E0S0_9ZZZZ